MKIVAIIQARMDATRLPGKMMMDLAGQPVIQRVFERVKPSCLINEIWLATTINPEDNILAEWAIRNDIGCYRGSSEDVLDRYYQTAIKAQAEVIVRITGDCPLHDCQVIDKIIEDYQKGEFDYVSNVNPPTFPDGLDVEVFSFVALERARKEAKLQSEREHVTSYIWKHPELFKIKNVTNPVDLSHYRWTLDTPEDYLLLQKIVTAVEREGGRGGLDEILKIMENNSDWLNINSQYQRNEGYVRSLNQENQKN